MLDKISNPLIVAGRWGEAWCSVERRRWGGSCVTHKNPGNIFKQWHQSTTQPTSYTLLSLMGTFKTHVNKYFSVLFQAFMSRRRKTKHYFTSSKYFQCWDSTSTSISCVYQKQYFILILYISPYPPFDLRNKCSLGKFEGNLNKTQKLHIGGWIFNGKKYESFGRTE